MRIGHGYDAHRFQSGGTLILGGVQIDHPQSLAAHSDGDVVLHAVCDALLGAIGAGDIGQHFPDTDPEYAGVSSRCLLREVYAKVLGQHFELGNLDITIIAQAPRMAAHLPAMRKLIAEDLNTTIGAINIKATTTERMGFTGREEGIAVHAVVLIRDALVP